MRRTVALLGAVAAVLLIVQTPAAAAVPREGHVSVADRPFEFCGLPNVTYAEETEYRLVSRQSGHDDDWRFTVFTHGWITLQRQVLRCHDCQPDLTDHQPNYEVRAAPVSLPMSS